MTSQELYQDYDEEEALQEGEPKATEITIPADDFSGSVEPGMRLEVVSVSDGVVTLRVSEMEEPETEIEAS